MADETREQQIAARLEARQAVVEYEHVPIGDLEAGGIWELYQDVCDWAWGGRSDKDLAYLLEEVGRWRTRAEGAASLYETAMQERDQARGLAARAAERAAALEEEAQREAEVADNLMTALAAAREEVGRLRVLIVTGSGYVEAVDLKLRSEAGDDGFIRAYHMDSVGPWHRLLGWARGHGVVRMPVDQAALDREDGND